VPTPDSPQRPRRPRRLRGYPAAGPTPRELRVPADASDGESVSFQRADDAGPVAETQPPPTEPPHAAKPPHAAEPPRWRLLDRLRRRGRSG
jgi:hypothetical protein